MPTVSQRNKSKVQLFVDTVWNDGRLELIDDMVAADYVGHLSSLSLPVLGPEGMRRLVSSSRGAHPDLYVKIDEQIAEHDLVAVRWRVTAGGQDEVTLEHRPRCSGISVIRLLAGKLVDSDTTVSTSATGVAA